VAEPFEVGDVALVDPDVAAGEDRLLGRIAGGGLTPDERYELAERVCRRVDDIGRCDSQLTVGGAERRQPTGLLGGSRERRVRVVRVGQGTKR
jgi:hypothetical protein